MERFKKLLPEIAEIKPVTQEDKTIFWEAYDGSGKLIGYAFSQAVPEKLPDIPGMDEMDKYQVDGIVEPNDCKVIKLDIAVHPDGPEEPWTMEITEPDFEKQFVGLSIEEMDLSPDGKIDAITDATMSSTWITNAIRDRISLIKKMK